MILHPFPFGLSWFLCIILVIFHCPFGATASDYTDTGDLQMTSDMQWYNNWTTTTNTTNPPLTSPVRKSSSPRQPPAPIPTPSRTVIPAPSPTAQNYNKPINQASSSTEENFRKSTMTAADFSTALPSYLAILFAVTTLLSCLYIYFLRRILIRRATIDLATQVGGYST